MIKLMKEEEEANLMKMLYVHEREKDQSSLIHTSKETEPNADNQVGMFNWALPNDHEDEEVDPNSSEHVSIVNDSADFVLLVDPKPKLKPEDTFTAGFFPKKSNKVDPSLLLQNLKNELQQEDQFEVDEEYAKALRDQMKAASELEAKRLAVAAKNKANVKWMKK